MRKLAPVLVVLLIALKQSSSIDRALEEFSEKEVRKHAAYLAGDDLEGRNAGYPGNDKAADYIADHFKDLGLKPVGDDDGYFLKFRFEKRNNMRGNLVKGEGGFADTRNVVGLLPGSGRRLKNELVVIGAHYDHVGTGLQADSGRLGKEEETDRIWNGADDNASGTSLLLEVARVFRKRRLKPKRSILFIAFSAEEHGLVGSERYVRKPVFPRARHAAMINLDMVGKGIDRLDISALATSLAWSDLIQTGQKLSGVAPSSLTSTYVGSSDHASFAKREIPCLFFTTGKHADYHQVTDHADRLDYGGLVQIGRLVTGVLWATANARKRPEWQDPKSAPKTGNVDKFGLRGVPLSEVEASRAGLKKGVGAIRVMKVDADTNAADSKIRVGDLLLGFPGRPLRLIDPVPAFQLDCEELVVGRPAVVLVLREGKFRKLRIKSWR